MSPDIEPHKILVVVAHCNLPKSELAPKKYREQTDIHISEVIKKISYRLQDRVLESVEPAVVYIHFDILCWRQVWLCNFPEQQLSRRASLGHSFSRKQ